LPGYLPGRDERTAGDCGGSADDDDAPQPWQVALDRWRAVDGQRIVRRLGAVSTKANEVSSVLVEIFVR